ncbi:PD-(D/E)XK motif protein [Prochlorococcus marinus str. XMU1401]|uniref:PD-(D/E)XK motif protein n=1 Tax=Prochlorococcus marinus str. XMU1401 TaxID=2052594 RepID=A0A8I2BKJ7_PROMR|nr:PD-(D/E)XK motif protein [Prochlorococcus marinus]MBO8223114.1 PD-(D/E)XK motif protein [Prochlorococcus marinus str. XMU1401]MBW3059652.1 hypothetical protein [Prochlorococcus marinus str. XMU1401E]
MLEAIKNKWEILEPIRKISKEEFEICPFDVSENLKPDSVLFFINDKNQKGILLKDDNLQTKLPKHGCSRLEIIRQNISIEGIENKFIKVTCLDESLNYAFSILLSRIIQLLIDGSSPSSATIDSVNELRKLLSRSRGPLPKEEEIIGLTGELIFLFSLVEKKQSLWKGWNGPFKASKDYTLSNIDVEFKASLQAGEPSITVNNLNQLEPVLGRSLYLFHSTLVKNPNGDISVPRLIKKIIEKIDDKDDFNNTLFAAGYSSEHEDLWDAFRFSVIEKSSYKVTNDFPRINQDSFINSSIPESITKIRYDIELNKLNKFKIENKSLIDLIYQSE